MSTFIPTERCLMGPGPSNVPDRVLNAMAQKTIGHLDIEFIQLMDQIKDLLRYAFKTNNRMVMPISAPGSAGMEACFVNLIEPGDLVLICINGVFGNRMLENVKRIGANYLLIEDEWGSPVSVDKVETALKENPSIKALAFVHAETSTGARSDAEALCRLAQSYNCLTIVDAVTSLGGIDLCVDEWGIDAIYSGTQKCLSCPPGISPISFSEKALDVVRSRKTPVQSWFLDLNLIIAYWEGEGPRAYHHTAPVNSMYALHESLLLLKEEGLENAFNRHQKCHRALAAGLEKIGLNFVVDPKYRLPQLNSVFLPEGVDDLAIRKQLLNEYNLEIGAGLGVFAGKVWRIGLMGNTCSEQNVLFCLEALSSVLNKNVVDVIETAKAYF